MVQNNRRGVDGSSDTALDAEPLLSQSLSQASSPTLEALHGQTLTTPIDPAQTVAEAEQWLTVIPPTAACYRLLQLGILRRDVALLEGLLSVLRNP